MARAAKGEGTMYPVDGGWRGYVTVNGRRKYFSAPTKALASQKRRALLLQRDTVGIAAGKGYKVGEWVQHWLDITKNAHKPKTHDGYQYTLDHYLSPGFKSIPLARLNVEAIEDEYKHLASFSGSTRAQVHSVLHSALKVAQKRGHVPINYAALVVDKPHATRAKVTSLSEADVAAIEQVIEGTRLEARWHLALSLGIRPGEALALEWADVDLDAGTIHVHQQLQKIGKETILVPTPKTDAGDRILPLPDYVRDALATWRARQLAEMVSEKWEAWSPDGKPHAWVFTSSRRPGRPVTDDGDSTQWRKILAAAGIPHTRRYSSRHTAASVLIAHGVDPAAVARILGHNDPAFTMRTYVHGIDERVQAAVSFLDRVQDKVQRPDDALQ